MLLPAGDERPTSETRHEAGMILFALLTWLLRPLLWIGRQFWDTFRIKDGSTVVLNGPGDSSDCRPELLCVGIDHFKGTCIIQIPFTIANSGRAAVSNLALRIQLPKRLTLDVPAHAVGPLTGVVAYSVDSGPYYALQSFEVPSLRIDESVTFPVLLRIRDADWIEVEAGEPREKTGNITLINYLVKTPVRIALLKIRITAHADNIRARRREWDLLLTPAGSLDSLAQKTHVCVGVYRIWSSAKKLFRFPVIGSTVFAPILKREFQQAALIHARAKEWVVRPEVGPFFDIGRSDEILPAEFSRRLLANPGKDATKFRDWLRRIQEARPPYYH